MKRNSIECFGFCLIAVGIVIVIGTLLAWERHVTADGGLYISIGFVITGIVTVLIGKAIGQREVAS